jgi:hypothetical protein
MLRQQPNACWQLFSAANMLLKAETSMLKEGDLEIAYTAGT